MDDVEKVQTLENEGLENKVIDSMGMSGSSDEAQDAQKNEESELPKGVKERLGRQEKRHQKEIREMRSQLQDMHTRMSSMQSPSQETNTLNSSTGQPPQGSSSEDMIHKAVSVALRHKEMEEQKLRDQEQAAHVHRQYQDMQSDLDKASEKYDDFDDVVRSPNAPYTGAMRDAALLIPNRAEVLYKLGKNPDELNRIAKLHPVDQAREMIKLSHALVNGETKVPSSTPKPMGSIKNMPVTSAHVTEKTAPSDIRARMKAGNWK